MFFSPRSIPYLGSSQVFNSCGTPSAVVIDEEGRVASEVGVGAQEVLAMARSADIDRNCACADHTLVSEPGG
jgi:hypothetical protein